MPFKDSDTARRDSALSKREAKPQVVSEEGRDNFRKDDDPALRGTNFAWVKHFIHPLTPRTSGNPQSK